MGDILRLLLTSTAVALASSILAAPPEIHVHFPIDPHDVRIPAVPATFILGNVQPPDAHLTINGQIVPLHPKGGFLAYLPVQPGHFTFRLEATNAAGTRVTEVPVYVEAPPLTSVTGEPTITPRSLEPVGDLELRPGDWVRARVRGSPGLGGHFDIDGVHDHLPMVETAPGLYEGAYKIRPEDEARSATIRLKLRGAEHPFEMVAPGRLTILSEPPYIAVFERQTYELNHVRTAPGGSFMLFLPNGVKAIVTGRVGDQARIRLSALLSGWASISDLRPLSMGPLPHATLRSLWVSPEARSSRITLELSEPVPYRVDHQQDLFRVLLYGTDTSVKPIVHAVDDPRIREIRWTHTAEGVAHVDIWLAEQAPLWGYDLTYGSQGLGLELRWPPPRGKDASSLAGTVIVLDPGHSPSDPGRIGPLGFSERTHNLRTARRLEALLRREGATVVMTRTSDAEEVSLQRRLDIAWQARGDVFLSLHNNSLAHGVDPHAKAHGFSIIYYHPHSLSMARHIHQAYRKHIPLQDEGVQFGNLFITRTTKMPSVLVESTYFIFPEQEQMLLDDAFQDKLAQALFEGLRDTFRDARTVPPLDTPIVRQDRPSGGLP
jgi:N-acetylmuramoyl-L-alanine amidase